MTEQPTPTQSRRNRALVEDMYAAALRGDTDTVRRAFAEDLTVREPGFLPYGGTYTGLQRFFELVARIDEHLDFARTTCEHLAAEGDKVVAAVSIPDRRTGRPVDIIDVATVRDGKIVELKIYFHDAQSMATASHPRAGQTERRPGTRRRRLPWPLTTRARSRCRPVPCSRCRFHGR